MAARKHGKSPGDDRGRPLAAPLLFCCLLILAALGLFQPAVIFSAMAEENDFFGEESEDNFLTWRGFVEMEGFFRTREEFQDEDRVVKNEIRSHLEVRYGSDDRFAFMAADLYLLPQALGNETDTVYYYDEDSGIDRNLRIYGREAEAQFNELYVNCSFDRIRLRAGNQKYAWGTADFFNPTAYANPYDLRELIFKDEEELKLGIPSLSAMAFTDAFTLEAVLAPVHVPTLLPTTDQFWAIRRVEGFFPVVIDDTQALDPTLENTGWGLRLSATRGNTDISFSAWRGPDHDPVLLPAGVVVEPGEPVALLIRPDYHVIHALGADVTMNTDAFVFQAEASWSPDKCSFVRQDLTDIAGITFPFEVEKSDYLAFAVGANWFVPLGRLIDGHTGQSVLSVEWYQSRFFKEGLNPPLLPDMFTCRYEDSFLDDLLYTEITFIYEDRHGGTIFWPMIGLDFQNGFTLEVSYAGIDGEGSGSWENDSLFYYFRDNDMVMAKVRYVF
ncbi:DUF1302 family protein [uncultured Desulfosarcina sp.]|uniref:DUF1302 family protein n=1 Tax=uncultured Desulfosarcina sp. TaxID=218289 RepID=UPI0029C7C767|nr:DUF1302 family protein [uncultured Desulfosarcina sp.]